MNVKQNMAQSHCRGYRSPTCWFPWPSLKLCCRGWIAEKSIIFSIWAPRTGGGSLLVFLEISYGMETRTRPPSVICSVFSSSEERDICTPPRSFFRLQNYFGMQTHCTEEGGAHFEAYLCFKRQNHNTAIEMKRSRVCESSPRLESQIYRTFAAQRSELFAKLFRRCNQSSSVR